MVHDGVGPFFLLKERWRKWIAAVRSRPADTGQLPLRVQFCQIFVDQDVLSLLL